MVLKASRENARDRPREKQQPQRYTRRRQRSETRAGATQSAVSHGISREYENAKCCSSGCERHRRAVPWWRLLREPGARVCSRSAAAARDAQVSIMDRHRAGIPDWHLVQSGDRAIWRSGDLRGDTAHRCPASVFVHRVRSGDLANDPAALCFARASESLRCVTPRTSSSIVRSTVRCCVAAGAGNSPLRHSSSFVSDRATSQSILQLCCFPVLETRPCAIRGPSSAIGRPHDSVLGIDDGAARSGQAIDPASQPFLQITRCRAVANGSDRHCFRTRSSDAS
jgi:hypothetical protein